VLLVVGSTHASTDHLPFLVEVAAGIDPAVVVAKSLGLQVKQLFDKQEATRSRLEAWGAGDESAITMKMTFILTRGCQLMISRPILNVCTAASVSRPLSRLPALILSICSAHSCNDSSSAVMAMILTLL